MSDIVELLRRTYRVHEREVDRAAADLIERQRAVIEAAMDVVEFYNNRQLSPRAMEVLCESIRALEGGGDE